jgi:uncharacterized protein with HEPN domain
MLSERARKALLDIRDNIALARGWSADLSLEDFTANRAVFYAVTRCLEIISEASRRLPPDLKHRHSHIPWRDIRDAGNIYRHDYDGVQERIVLDTVRISFPELDAVLDQELGVDP